MSGKRGRFHGLLVIDKPGGWTSHDVVALVRRLLGERRVGHAGTLDPAATGVLPVAIGDGTKVLEYLSETSKTYLAEITFGFETDSDDADGRVVATSPVDDLEEARVRATFGQLVGEIEQLPPLYSAVSVGGRRLYAYARAGQAVERPARRVTVHLLELLTWAPPVATVVVDCSKGTYVRSLAHDAGRAVGTGAHLSNLVRLRTGPFTLEDAWTLGELAQLDLEAEWPAVALHPDAAMADQPALILDEAAARDWGHGKPLALSSLSPVTPSEARNLSPLVVNPPVDPDRAARQPARVYDAAGDWLGVADFDPEAGLWRPAKVVGTAA